VPFGESAAGAGLEIALEASGDAIVGELDRDNYFPGSVLAGIAIRTMVVPPKTVGDITCSANVRFVGMRLATQNVDEELLCCGHARRCSTMQTNWAL
jgi:hypothetical protein